MLHIMLEVLSWPARKEEQIDVRKDVAFNARIAVIPDRQKY